MLERQCDVQRGGDEIWKLRHSQFGKQWRKVGASAVGKEVDGGDDGATLECARSWSDVGS